ncbi:MAG: type II secretion system GspH family protein [Candidatus Nomurabacteria bacterium]|jgi:prepilin-type N-terminal cleavage/methylation domain-containing protein|nr:type II secretion system GspH family protein [Candidatus Nomurabacteria bacterium]
MKKGFTIIEVVLVLAIAGLIFLMIFIALPALQMAQRDNARKQDVQKIAAAINTWRSNNRGARLKSTDVLDSGNTHEEFYEDSDGNKTSLGNWGNLPDSWQLRPLLNDQISPYVTSIGVYDNSSSGDRYMVGENDTAGHVTVTVGRSCPATDFTVQGWVQLPSAPPNHVSVIVILEKGGFFCVDV